MTPRFFGYFSNREWWIAETLFISFVGISVCIDFFAVPYELNPAHAISIAALFFGGLRLWPVVLFAAVIAGGLAGAEPLVILLSSVSSVLQAVVGAYLLRRWKVDPIFRHKHDTIAVAFTACITALLAPLYEIILQILNGGGYTGFPLIESYVASAFSFIILLPFVLRWTAKPPFYRSLKEMLEILAAFSGLILILCLIFVARVDDLWGISLGYFLLVPLFYIALRLRPRFASLAIVVTALFALIGTWQAADTATVAEQLFQMEILLIVVAASFLIVSTLEEDRRVNISVMSAQMTALRNAAMRASSDSTSKNDFMSILAHELSNPLAPVVSGIELLEARGPRDADEKTTLGIMSDSIKTVRRLLEDLMDATRISEGKVRLKKEIIELGPVIQRAVLSTEHHRKELGQKLVEAKFPEPLFIFGDPVRVEQIFSNLLTNASKYSDSEDTITLRVRHVKGFAEIEVIDEGVGLDPAALETIFLPFRQVESGERHKGGLGIGLTLVNDFVHMHGGTVTAESDGAGKGSVFIVRLPTVSPAGVCLTKDGVTTGLHVVVVDNDDRTAASIGRLLELEGNEVSYGYSGTQAIGLLSLRTPNVIILSLQLSKEDGIQVAKTIRKEGFSGRLIALNDEGHTRGHRTHELFDAYLEKPVNPENLHRILAVKTLSS